MGGSGFGTLQASAWRPASRPPDVPRPEEPPSVGSTSSGQAFTAAVAVAPVALAGAVWPDESDAPVGLVEPVPSRVRAGVITGAPTSAGAEAGSTSLVEPRVCGCARAAACILEMTPSTYPQ